MFYFDFRKTSKHLQKNRRRQKETERNAPCRIVLLGHNEMNQYGPSLLWLQKYSTSCIISSYGRVEERQKDKRLVVSVRRDVGSDGKRRYLPVRVAHPTSGGLGLVITFPLALSCPPASVPVGLTDHSHG